MGDFKDKVDDLTMIMMKNKLNLGSRRQISTTNSEEKRRPF
jgi:hypothetical protein